MSGIPSEAEIEAAKAALQANVGSETKKQAGSSIGDVAGNVAIEGVGEVVGAAVEAVAEGIGAAATAAGEAVVTVIGGIFEGVSS